MNDRAPRLEKLPLDRLDDDQRALHQAIAGGRRAEGPQLFQLVDDAGALEGPFNAFLLQPRLGLSLQALGASIRYETSLSDRAREIAILVVAGLRDCAFERYAHEAVGRHVGLADDEIAALGDGSYELLPSATEQVVARIAHRLLEAGDLDDEAYTEAVDALGLRGLFELLTLVGYYDTLSLQLRVFRVASPGPA